MVELQYKLNSRIIGIYNNIKVAALIRKKWHIKI